MKKLAIATAICYLTLTGCANLDDNSPTNTYQEDVQGGLNEPFLQDYDSQYDQDQQDYYRDEVFFQCVDENWPEAYDEDYLYDWCEENAMDYLSSDYEPDYYDDYEPNYP